MEEINSILNIDKFKILAEINQNCSPSDNFKLTAYKIGKRIVIEEDNCCNNKYYILDKNEERKFNSSKGLFLNSLAEDWSDNCEDSRLEKIKWFGDLHNYEVDEEYKGKCKIIAEGCFYGYTPFFYICDERGDDKIFEDINEARKWIKGAESGLYYLNNNEWARPYYCIVSE